MIFIEAGNLGSLYRTYHAEDKGAGIDAWREGDMRHLRWGAYGVTVEFGRSSTCKEGRPWRIGWGWADQITLRAAKAR